MFLFINMEIWKDIKGYEGIYQVSNTGRVKRLVGYQRLKEKILKNFLCGKNWSMYYKVRLYKKDNGKYFAVHRLMALAFLDNPNNYLEVRHLDGDRFNNVIENLAFGTHQMNMQDSIKHGTFHIPDNTGERNGKSKLTEFLVKEIRYLYDNNIMRQNKIAAKYKMSLAGINAIVLRKNWKHVK